MASGKINPIEHVCDLHRAAQRQANVPTTAQEMMEDGMEEWRNLDQDSIKYLIMGMPEHMLALIRAIGDNNDY